MPNMTPAPNLIQMIGKTGDENFISFGWLGWYVQKWAQPLKTRGLQIILLYQVGTKTDTNLGC